MNEAKLTETIYDTFVMEGVRHLVTVERTLDNYFMIKVIPQIPDEVLNSHYLCEDVKHINIDNFKVHTLFQMIINFLDQCHYEAIREYARYGMGHSSNMSVSCMNLMNQFESESNVQYVELRRRLIRTGDIINFAIADSKKRIYFTYDISVPYVKLDYNQLEFSIYNLSKLAMVLTCVGSESYFEISSSCDEFIDLFIKIPLQQNQPFCEFRNEIRAVKHVFNLLGGHFDFYEEEGFLCGSGYFDAKFSSDHHVVPRGMRLVLKRSIRDMLERRKNKKFWTVFDYDEKFPVLRMPVEHMPEELDMELRYAQIFFEGVELLNQI